MLTQDELKTLLTYNPDTGVFRWNQPGSGQRKDGVAGTRTRQNYIQIGIHRRLYRAHRLAFLYMTGVFPERGLIVDHINRDRMDNKWSNLRLVTHAQNNMNMSLAKNNTSEIQGVSWHKGDACWRAHIQINRNYVHLGNYQTKDAAQTARYLAEKVLSYVR